MPSCGLCVLDPTADGALQVSGGSTISVPNNTIQVNSPSATAAIASGLSTVSAQYIGIVGGWQASGGATFTPTPVQDSAIADPFANSPVPVPPNVDYGTLVAGDGQQLTASPGIYSTLGASGSGQLTLLPGIYEVTVSFTNSGTGTIHGQGVTLYFPVGGSLHLSGSSYTRLSAPHHSNGFVVFYDRANTAPIQTDDVTAILAGVIYGQTALLNVQELSTGMAVVGTVNVHSGGTLTMQC